jgi:hypothetical protein
MSDIKDLTTLQICELRLKCVEVFVSTASRAGLEKETVFTLGEKLFEFITKPLTDSQKKDPAKASSGKK